MYYTTFSFFEDRRDIYSAIKQFSTFIYVDFISSDVT